MNSHATFDVIVILLQRVMQSSPVSGQEMLTPLPLSHHSILLSCWQTQLLHSHWWGHLRPRQDNTQATQRLEHFSPVPFESEQGRRDTVHCELHAVQFLPHSHIVCPTDPQFGVRVRVKVQWSPSQSRVNHVEN